MRRAHIVLVTNPACEEEADLAFHMLERMSHMVESVFDAEEAIEKINEQVGKQAGFEAVIVDGFAFEDAEMIALTIKTQFKNMYVGIMSKGERHRVPNEYANEVIPEAFVPFKEAMECRFSGAI